MIPLSMRFPPVFVFMQATFSDLASLEWNLRGDCRGLECSKAGIDLCLMLFAFASCALIGCRSVIWLDLRGL